MKRIIIAIILGLVSLQSMVVSAGAPVSLVLADVELTGCGGTLIEGRLRLLAYDAQGVLVNATVGLATTVSAIHSNGAAPAVNWSFIASDSYQFAYSVAGPAVTHVSLTIISAAGLRAPTATINCDGSVSIAPVGGTDSRINLNNCDLTSALYSTSAGIEVWDIQADSTGLYQGAYTADDIAAYADAPPSVNTFIGAIGKTTAEILTTGEVQIKIAPDAEGKSCTVILDGIPASSVYFN
ncbi:MAG: hypothetical protein IPK52_25720 [Chloroflexi bacterium]|nr:hypothetical protein [Chloroflexota bacterium]